ncbi:MAG: 3D domain-containing protein [Berkelbacteria bacterium GW2011_GWB1_38_5]|uniref:3D domain-containing protein n=2 Tax=Candidatus Berkelbacteria TaxID=1618330 RepID=A0A0G0I1Z6_9BACT|nr:MAG: 3D domain-containing protein [Berkelbacteria bacterium GW2011_GWA1_36_9]KKQ73724.1 MAG: 3D domain-containing protein [Berkelbacteria bacterium GW2011_GWB1_38_5]
MVSGVVDVSDPNHPKEVYFGGPNFFTLQEMTKDLNVDIYPEDKSSTFPDPSLGIGSRIDIQRALPVEITDAKITKIYRTWQKTIDELFKENNIELLGQDSVDPLVSTSLRPDIKIKITRVAEVEVTEKESINYSVVKRTSVDVEKGQTEIDTKGVKGEKDVIYVIRRVDGVEVAKTKKSETVVKKPISEVVIIGIGPKYAKSGPYKDTINSAARNYLINGTALMCLMLRESGGTADTGYPDAMYKGLFQYEEGFWADISAKAGYGGSSIYNAQAQIFTTAYALTHGYGGRWPPWGGCANK